MKLWEILPQLKEGQSINVTYKDGSKAEFVYGGTYLWHKRIESKVSIRKEIFEADYELIPQFIPFEEALKAYKEGKRICCDSPKYGKTFYDKNDQRAATAVGIESEIIAGKWWVVK